MPICSSVHPKRLHGLSRRGGENVRTEGHFGDCYGLATPRGMTKCLCTLGNGAYSIWILGCFFSISVLITT